MKKTFATVCAIAFLSGCAVYPPTPKPDYTIRVTPDANGNLAAIPPECPSWSGATADPFDAQPVPQFGCASARNLALMVDQPQDLVQGRDFGPASGVTTVGAMRRYNANQTRGLIYPSSAPDTSVESTTSSTSSSALSGEAAGGSSSSSSSSSTSASP